MRFFWRKAKPKTEWHYVGTVEGRTLTIGSDGSRISGGLMAGYWILSERGPTERRVKAIGNAGWSQHARQAETAVEVWLQGGPLPTLWMEPERDEVELIVFPGGKSDGAA